MKENENPLEQLYGIVDDLWGAAKEAPAPMRTEEEPPKPAFKTASSAPAPVKKAPDFPPFDRLWRVADESVDWTDALAHTAPTDGYTSPVLWAYFHEHAEKVLEGNVDAYVEVLKAANPLGDLTAYAKSFNVTAESPDRLTVRFEVAEPYVSAGEPEKKRYLAGMSLRCARDLMALLPVCEVTVKAMQGEKKLLDVSFARCGLQKVRFTYVDPVAFVETCGGTWAE